MSDAQQPVARTDELRDGEMKQVQIGDHKVLLVRIEGQYHALGAHCTHYGAPLVDGALHGRRLVCPWHHACFDAATGHHLEAPGMDGLPKFEVEVRGEDLYVFLPDQPVDRVPNPMASKADSDDRVFAIVGAGAAGAYAAEGMREAGFEGRIVMINAEDELPYDRPNCSKAYLAGEAPEAWMPLRGGDFYKERGIEVLRNSPIDRLDTERRVVHFVEGGELAYDKVVIASGATPRELEVEGHFKEDIYTLRSLQDSRILLEMARQPDKSRAVVVGASFIGLEVAASLHALGLEVDVVSPEEVPLAGVFGKRIGRMMQGLHEEKGIRFHLGRRVSGYDGERRVRGVLLDNGDLIGCDLVVLGVGVDPATGFVQGLEKMPDGGIKVDAYLRQGEHTYAAGDVAAYRPEGEAIRRIEHWQVAAQQGRVAGMNAAGAEKPFDAVPFFWTRQHGHSLAYVGHAPEFDRVIYQGEVESQDFLAFYLDNGQLRAVSGMGRGKELAAIHALMHAGQMPTVQEIEAGTVDWTGRG